MDGTASGFRGELSAYDLTHVPNIGIGEYPAGFPVAHQINCMYHGLVLLVMRSLKAIFRWFPDDSSIIVSNLHIVFYVFRFCGKPTFNKTSLFCPSA